MHLNEVIHKKQSEQIEMMLRRHPLTFVPKIVLFLVLIAVRFIFPILFQETLLQNPFWGVVLFLVGSIYLLLVLVLFLAQFIDYYLDVWIITNERIIDINQAGLFKRTVGELDLEKVQDAGSEIKGFFATFFNYGDVEIQTAGVEQKFKFFKVPKSHLVRNKVLELAEINRTRQGQYRAM